MAMPVPMSGGCACGAVRYECSAAPFRPTHDIYTDSAQPWDYMDASLRKFPRLPD